jgi:hypothetical protein
VIETDAVLLRSVSLLTVSQPLKPRLARTSCPGTGMVWYLYANNCSVYPPRNTTFDSAICHYLLQSPYTSPSIFLSPRLIFTVFLLTFLVLRRHAPCVVTTVTG